LEGETRARGHQKGQREIEKGTNVTGEKKNLKDPNREERKKKGTIANPKVS